MNHISAAITGTPWRRDLIDGSRGHDFVGESGLPGKLIRRSKVSKRGCRMVNLESKSSGSFKLLVLVSAATFFGDVPRSDYIESPGML